MHYDWHWIWATGNGDIGNQGIHQMDLGRWFLNEPGLARHTLSVGGRFGYVDDGETPNTQAIVHDYPSAPLIFEVRGLPEKAGAANMGDYKGASIGLVVHCEGGYLMVPSYTEAKAFDQNGKLVKEFVGEGNHFANFIDCVRSRRAADLKGPIQQAQVSSALCHLGNVSHRLGQAQPTGQLDEQIRGNSEMTEAVGRMQEHLAANNVDLGQTPATLGMPLAWDDQAQHFIDNPEANKLLKREYRAPYVVPQLA